MGAYVEIPRHSAELQVKRNVNVKFCLSVLFLKFIKIRPLECVSYNISGHFRLCAKVWWKGVLLIQISSI